MEQTAKAPLGHRLYPSLLDRLTDNAPDVKEEPPEHRVLRAAQLRAGVLRDLVWLLNTVRPDDDALAAVAQVRQSVLNYGLPALSGQSLANLQARDMERAIHDAIVCFEPRIDAATLSVTLLRSADMTHHQHVGFEIRGQLWSHPYPVELLLKTQLDVECGEFRLDDER